MTSPWMTTREAADFLSESLDSVYRRLVKSTDKPGEGELRYHLLHSPSGRDRIRVLREDVYALLPLPKPGTLAAVPKETP